MVDKKQIQAIIEDLEHKEGQLNMDTLDSIPSSMMVPALYSYFKTELKGLIHHEAKD